ncbi:DEAD/DEAH box helicase family protein [Herbaspirillum sp. CAH-3]|uniref:DEAD/DEAH box helicase family protein n=1 Tax=Herbaspirillum sp. CAH-3 TaxID=2605746 RepID=UPI0012ACE270|nr:DEAD/DEAH box helicase family protein [Herbaspirillum sp. CAH-3]MRT30448.1 hypothetical protein [Herbaspirillum sp. CAH-3]
MQVTLPALLSLSEKSDYGVITQIARPSTTVDGALIPFTLEKSVGYVLRDNQGTEHANIFASKPKGAISTETPILIAKVEALDDSELDLSDKKWWSAAGMTPAKSIAQKASAAARMSWRGAFQFFPEDPKNPELIGLRKPQLGALHAIHAHWSVSRETATLVMPTGTGKTETMLSVLLSVCCERVLVVVPSDALRTQIAEKFETLGMLKMRGSRILTESAQWPVVGRLLSSPKSVEDVDAFFFGLQCDCHYQPTS